MQIARTQQVSFTAKNPMPVAKKLTEKIQKLTVENEKIYKNLPIVHERCGSAILPIRNDVFLPPKYFKNKEIIEKLQNVAKTTIER